jgi:putative ABC transport system substrate-binding protein
VIAANSPAAVAAKAATTTIPIVFDSGTDPVKLGLVASLSRPGSNLTGVSNLNLELGPKRLELIHELVPTADVVALLVNPDNPGAANVSEEMQAAARTAGVKLHILHARTERDFTSAFASIAQLRAGALVITTDPFFISQIAKLAPLSLHHAVPTIFEYREFAAAGGLISYGGDPTEPYRLMGNYTGRVLKGEKPSDLPVQQSTKLELIINLKTANALGLTISREMQLRANEVIE